MSFRKMQGEKVYFTQEVQTAQAMAWWKTAGRSQCWGRERAQGGGGEVGVLVGAHAPGVQVCVLVGTQAALRCTSDTPSRTWIYSGVLVHTGKS